MDPEKNNTEAEKQTSEAIEDVTNGPLRLSLDQDDIKNNVGLQEYVEARKGGVVLVTGVLLSNKILSLKRHFRHRLTTGRFG